jgi:TRAP-type C4-dicarboxylate transport system permease small subunit
MHISSFVFASILIFYSFSLSSSHFSFNFGSLALSYSLLPSVMPLLSVALFLRLFFLLPSLPFTAAHFTASYQSTAVCLYQPCDAARLAPP